MKKFSVILLIAVLAMTSVFAGVTGSVTATYKANFDTKAFGYTKPASALKASLVFDDMSAAKKGEGLAWVDAGVSFKWTAIPQSTVTKAGTLDGMYGLSTLGYFTLKIDKFNICSSNLTIDLTTASALGDLATSGLNPVVFTLSDAAGTEKAVNYNVKDTVTGNGATVTWSKGFTFAVAANGTFGGDTDSEYYLGVRTPDFKLGENFNLQGASSFKYTAGLKWETDASVKFSFKADNASVVAAADNKLTFGKGVVNANGKKVTYNMDADVKAHVFFADAEVYFAKDATLTPATWSGYTFDWANYGVKKANTYEYDITKVEPIHNLFSASLAFNFAQFDVPLTLTFTGLDLLNDYRVFNVDAAVDFGFINATLYGHDLLTSKAYCGKHGAKNVFHTQQYEGQAIGAEVEATVADVITLGGSIEGGIVDKYVKAGLSAEYEHPYFDAAASINMKFAAATTVNVNASISSEKLVDGAALTLKYAGSDYVAKKLGTLTATCKVTF